MLVSEQNLEDAIRTFYSEMGIKRPSHWTPGMDLLMLKKSVFCFISALEKIEDIDFCHGFDPTKVITE